MIVLSKPLSKNFEDEKPIIVLLSIFLFSLHVWEPIKTLLEELEIFLPLFAPIKTFSILLDQL